MRQFDLIFYKGKGFVSNFIKKVGNMPYSHVAIIIDKDCLHTIESDYKEPLRVSHFSYNKHDFDIYRLNIELTEKQMTDIINFIMDKINTRYDWKFLLSRFFRILFNTRTYDSKNLFNCDELIYEAFLSAGIRLVENKDNLTPQTLSNSKYLIKIKEGLVS